jgi:hypothetical protein
MEGSRLVTRLDTLASSTSRLPHESRVSGGDCRAPRQAGKQEERFKCGARTFECDQVPFPNGPLWCLATAGRRWQSCCCTDWRARWQRRGGRWAHGKVMPVLVVRIMPDDWTKGVVAVACSGFCPIGTAAVAFVAIAAVAFAFFFTFLSTRRCPRELRCFTFLYVTRRRFRRIHVRGKAAMQKHEQPEHEGARGHWAKGARAGSRFRPNQMRAECLGGRGPPGS